mgnify:FL=1
MPGKDAFGKSVVPNLTRSTLLLHYPICYHSPPLITPEPRGQKPVITLYGIKNCDTVKKARKWLEGRGIDYTFHDVREDGLDREQVQKWLEELGWETLVNRRSTSWKALDEQVRANMDDAGALEAILEQPTLIKRPLLDTGGKRHTGFSAASYQQLFSAHTL